MLGAAFAGLSCLATEANAATVFTETTDFSNSYGSPTDLSSIFANFLDGGSVVGQMVIGSDYADVFSVNVTPNTLVSIPWTVSNNTPEYFGLGVANPSSGNAMIAFEWVNTVAGGTPVQRTLNFTTPASGKITFYTSQESGSATFNYTVGPMVPEPTTGLLSLAGLAAAALRRRRENL